MFKCIKSLRNSEKFRQLLGTALVLLLILYVFSIPSFSNRTGFNLLTYVLMILFGLATFLYCFLYRGFKIHPVAFLIPAFVIFSFLGTAINSHNFRGWLSLVLLGLSSLLFLYSFSIIKNRYNVLRAISIGLFIFSLYFIIIYRSQIIEFKSFAKEEFRLGSIFDNPNGVASYMVVSYGVSLSVFLFGKRKIDLLFIFPILTSCLVGFSTGSKTFLLAIFIFTAVILFFKFIRYKWLYLIILVVLIALVGILISLPFMDTIRERFVHFFETLLGTAEKVDTSSLSRLVWFQYGFYLGGKNMIFGYGYGGFSIYSGVGTYSHSNFSEVFCNFGLIGLLLFYSPLVVCLVKSIVDKRVNLSLTIPFFVYYILVSFSNVFYYNKTYYLMVALITYCCFEEGIFRSVFKTKVDLKKILFTCDSMGSGGAERVISILSDEMCKRGYDVSILMISNHECSSFYNLNDNVKLNCLCENSTSKIFFLKRLFLLRKYIKEAKPSVIISFLPHVSVYTYFANFGLDIHHIISERNDPKMNPTNKSLRLLKKFVFKNSDGGVFQCEESMLYFGKRVTGKSKIISNPIKSSGVFKRNFSDCNYTIVTAGRFTNQKNLSLLIDSFNQALKIKQELKLKIYGDGPLKENLVSQIRTLGLEEKVSLCGTNENWLIDSINDSLFVLTSNYEGMPNSLLEALFAGLPCISTDCPVGVSRLIIKDGENGFLVKCNDVNALSKKILDVFLLGEKLELFAKNNQKLKELYSPSFICDQWIMYIEEVLNNEQYK